MYYLPWWGLLACLAASALATYLLLGRTQAGDSPWALFPLTAILAPVVLLGAMVVAITLSTLLSAFLLEEDRTGLPADPSEPPAAHTTTERPGPATTASPSASPTASSP